MVPIAALLLGIGVLITAACFIGFKLGWSTGYRAASGIVRSGGFVASLHTLQEFRRGNITNAVRRLEDYCYSTAADLLEYPTPQREIVAKWFKEDLIRYRVVHPRPLEEQSATEQRLDRLLR
jgi:hypothetical protein